MHSGDHKRDGHVQDEPAPKVAVSEPDDTRNHRVYLRLVPETGAPIFLCHDCWTEDEPMLAVVPLGHGKLQ